MDRAGPGVDWRDAEAYAPLLGADRSILAWEWLRRDPGYREAFLANLDCLPGRAPSPPIQWGLHAFEPPDRAVPSARPLWVAAVHPLVLAAVAEPPRSAADAFDWRRLAPLVTVAGGRQSGEHVLLSDGLRTIRIDVAGSVREGPVQLRYLLEGIVAAERPLLTLRRLLALCRSGRFSAALHPPDVRAARFILMLRVQDALSEGATQREIAATLLNAEARAERWRVSAPTLRTRAQRLVRAARRMTAGGYKALLA